MENILLSLAVLVATGRLAGLGSVWLKLPPVVGEILVGVVLANLPAPFGPALFEQRFLHELAEIGIILMLFNVALESTPADVARVGGRAFVVAVVGVVAPFALVLLGYRAGLLDPGALPGGSAWVVPVFVGATLTATSIGITARVLGASGHLASRTAQVILGAAVLDDVLGLLVLAAVTSFVTVGNVSGASLAVVAGKVALFFALALPIGYRLLPRALKSLSSSASLTAFGLSTCLLYSWLGAAAGLAPIVGAFFAGLLLDDPKARLRLRMEPIVEFTAPIFFVLIGAQVRVGELSGAGLGGVRDVTVLFVLAVVGKLACALVSGPGVDRLAVGMGMIPRGEVGLIFAVSGRTLGVVSDRLFAVLVIVVLLSTILPAFALDRRLARLLHLK